MYIHVRECTNKILNAIEEGILDRDEVLKACLNWLSESSVKEMAEASEFFSYEEDEDEDEFAYL